MTFFKWAQIISVFFLWYSIAHSQKYSFINYSIENGLPQSQVSSFTQDQNGYLWIGTMGGLAKFNGQSFFTFSTRNGILNNRISSLNYCHDSILIGHEGGFSIGKNDLFSAFSFEDKDKSVPCSKVVVFRNTVFAFTNGSGFYYLKDKRLKNKSLQSNDENRIRAAIIKNNQLIIGTRGGILMSDNGFDFKILKGTDKLNVSGLTDYGANKLAFCTFNGEIGIYSLSTNQIHYVKINQEIFGLRNCFTDSKNQLWIPHLEGIILVDSYLKAHNINKSIGLEYENINAVFEDDNQTIWIGSEGKGIFKFSGNHIRKYVFENAINSDLILSILKTNKVSYYGTYDVGVIAQNNTSKQTKLLKLENNPVWALASTDQNEILAGTGAGLFRVAENKLTEVPFPKTRPKITSLLSYKDLCLVGGDFGLAIYKNQSITQIYTANKHDLLTVRCLALKDNIPYIGSDNGLFTLTNGNIVRAVIFNQKINSLKSDTDGRLWIGTEDGLFVMDNNQIKAINLSHLPSSNIINFINTDAKHLIVGTNDGVYYSDLTKKTWLFKKIGLEEGLSNLETNINSSFVDKQQTIYFGTVSGLNVLNINSLEKGYILQKPHIIIKQISVNFIPIIKSKESYKTTYATTGEISQLELPYHKNNILIELDGITLKNYTALSYQYWVEGLDKDWSSKFKNPQINITNLPHGDYKIHIRGILGDNLFSKVKTISLTINPPFYLRTWFLILVSISFIGLVYFVFTRSIKRAQEKSLREKNEIQNRLGRLEQQSLNASMNRHFIFNALNSIQYYINKEDKLSANRYLTNFAKLIRKNLDSSTDQTSLVPLDEELERLRLYLDLEMMRFKERFTYEIDDEDVITDDYYVPAMLLQPFVENSILHGILPSEKPGKIIITINDFPNHLEIRIKDNGVGIKKSLESKGINAESHKSKGMEISSKRIDLLRQYFNENFELIGPYQTLDENGLINGTTVIIKIPK